MPMAPGRMIHTGPANLDVYRPHLRAQSWKSTKKVCIKLRVVGVSSPGELGALDAGSTLHLRVPAAPHS